MAVEKAFNFCIQHFLPYIWTFSCFCYYGAGDFKISIISSEGDNLYEENDLQNCEELYNRLIVITERILKVLKDQQDKGNFRWKKDNALNV
ncbi:hypothetical protein RhiirA5_433677 [Rhizophagus irregularis]|uniref:Uncharacterized protein n=1 Tax=Rhizophagus irregularis TaxID=588596 RepID=A0A2N0NRD9_9GLOM|nr:hypothetical protein RhiirA5_433677 [Rhizophagus irregularis]